MQSAEGRALGRHGNRVEIIYPDGQVPTLARNGDHEIRVSEMSFAPPEPLFLPGKGVL